MLNRKKRENGRSSGSKQRFDIETGKKKTCTTHLETGNPLNTHGMTSAEKEKKKGRKKKKKDKKKRGQIKRDKKRMETQRFALSTTPKYNCIDTIEQSVENTAATSRSRKS